jgi:hypothetical protein
MINMIFSIFMGIFMALIVWATLPMSSVPQDQYIYWIRGFAFATGSITAVVARLLDHGDPEDLL